MYASVAGLKTHMQKLTVIGNNVANVNTQGYKKQRTVFRDSVYSMYSAGSNGTSTVGGMNPSQLGYGSQIGSIDLNMSSASYNPGNEMDCALVGDGFFLVGTKDIVNSTNPSDYSTFKSEDLKALSLTRVGDFKQGPDNYIVDGQGNVVYGFMPTSEVESYLDPADNVWKERQKVSDQLVPLRFPRWERVETKDGDETKVTYEIRYARTDIGTDEDGNQTYSPENYGKAQEDHYQLVDDEPRYHAAAGATNIPDAYEFAKLDSISVDAKTGCISGISTKDGKPVIIGYIAIGKVTNPNGVSHIGKSYYKCGDGAGTLNITMLGGVQEDLDIDHVNGSMLKVADGQTAQYAGGTDILSGDTEMMVGFLEAPNVDLAEEIAELITTQRGYQANTRIITVTDSMLEELVNMKR